MIAKSIINISVEDLWNIKILFVIGAFLIAAMITQSNTHYKLIEVINGTDNSAALLFAGDNVTEEAARISQENQEKEKMIFKKVQEKYYYDGMNDDENVAVGKIAQYMEVNKLSLKDVPTEDTARSIYSKLQKYYALQNTDYSALILLAALAFFIPDVYLMFKAYMLKFFIYNEYLKLEVTTIMVGKLEPIKVEEILNVLSDNSKYFKKYIDEIRFNYFNVKDGNARAFDAVIEKVSHKELRYLLKALQQASESDLKMTIENLENQRKSNKEFRNIMEQNKLKKKELVGILVLLIMLFMICLYVFMPLSSLINEFKI